MMTPSQLCLAAVFLLSGGTALLLAGLGWFGARRDEEHTANLVYAAFGLTLTLSLVLCGLALFDPSNAHTTVGFTWFHVADYHFELSLVADWVSIPFSALCALLCALIAAFSRRYLHREAGYHRFYFLLALFAFAVQTTVLAGSLDVVFVGWELVGLCSALLIAFFHERRKPVENGLRTFLTYRVCDVGLLSAVVWVHHTVGTTAFTNHQDLNAFGLMAPSSARYAALIGLLLIWAALGKGGQVPFGGWLPKAMEGPTPSSAIFYGAISVHLAPFLLLRAAPVLEQSVVAQAALVVLGLLSALHGTFAGRAQTDIKSILAFASMTQLGLILIEIGLGFYTVALIHALSHACVRSLQILSSPNVLREYQQRERGLGQPVPRTGGHLERLVPKNLQPWLYRLALERGYYDAILQDYVVGPFVRSFRRIDAAEQHLTAWLEGATAPPDRRPTNTKPATTKPEPRLDDAQ